MTQPTLLSFKSSKIKIPDPSQNIKTNNPPTSQSQPSEINSKLHSNKNTSEHEGKMSRRRDRSGSPHGSLSDQTSPSPLPSITRWSMDRWEEEYWKLTNKPPQEILKEAYELNDPGVLVLVDEIERGVKNDRRNPKFRGKEEYALPPGSWPLMVHLVKILETKRRGGK